MRAAAASGGQGRRASAAIDLRSDTVTLPTDAMREAMQAAPLGDDGLEGDPTVRRLEQMAASLLGKPAALFVASGTMGNLVASLAHASRGGGEAIADADAHIVRSESGGIARLAGLFCHCVPHTGGEMALERVRELLRPVHARTGQPTAMVVVESSHNHAGGAVPPLAYMAELRAMAAAAGVAVHLDGARLFNAALALGVPARELAAQADSVTFCLSKGLSAPMGSLLAGDADFVARARTYRRMVGGGLRQAGVVAAAGIVALEQMCDRLAEDHGNARHLWALLRAADPRLVAPAAPQTNIVMVDLSHRGSVANAPAAIEALAAAGVLMRARDRVTLRAVTHRHVDRDAMGQAAARMLRVLA
ncbi:MAG: threonine aldolase family protein [Burkholderiaceae bacterium]|nr:threonine aldolase family protein [Burkholderiaceae bacterium]